MPEIAEVARAVHYLRKHLVGRKLAKVTAVEDGNVFGKVGTSHTEIMKHLTGKEVMDAGQQGKYFWMIMSSPPHPVMHFGMAGWLRFKSEHTFYYRKKENEDEQWPPKYWRVMFETDGKGDDKIEAAYVDLRRFGRIRLVDCPGKDIRHHSPLVENGPDPVQDKDKVTVTFLKNLCHRKKVPVKAMLLDQANISGIGNWVGDEVMYHARMHPEQYANTLSDEQIEQLHKSLHYICKTAVDLLAETDQFPEEWLFKHRWGKGKKGAANELPNGEKIVFLTVGGRTSAVVPSMQKKTGPVAKEMSEAEDPDQDEKPNKTAKRAKNEPEEKAATKKRAASKKRVKEESDVSEEESALKQKTTAKKQKKETGTKGETELPSRPSKRGRSTKANPEAELEKPEVKTVRVSESKSTAKNVKEEQPVLPDAGATSGRRRSGRLQK